MNDHSDALTPEIKEMVERARQFQEWADENGFGIKNTNNNKIIQAIELLEIHISKTSYAANVKGREVQEALELLRSINL